jgi:hypothetical protein
MMPMVGRGLPSRVLCLDQDLVGLCRRLAQRQPGALLRWLPPSTIPASRRAKCGLARPPSLTTQDRTI